MARALLPALLGPRCSAVLAVNCLSLTASLLTVGWILIPEARPADPEDEGPASWSWGAVLEPAVGSLPRPSAANRTVASTALIYNRVAKCGSSTLVALLRLLAARHGFTALSSRAFHVRRLDPRGEAELAATVRAQQPVAYDRHFYHFDWALHGLRVNMINMVREPVDRLVSNFHFVRNPRRWAGREVAPPQTWFTKSLQRCVVGRDPECLVGGERGAEMALTYFCGAATHCTNSSSLAALQTAKAKAETEYSVVGVMEQFNASLAVLEAYLPGWFAGATGLLGQVPAAAHNRNPHPPAGQLVRAVLAHRLRLDTDFYRFVRQRLQLQLGKLQNSS
jgi:hypothetical protein